MSDAESLEVLLRAHSGNKMSPLTVPDLVKTLESDEIVNIVLDQGEDTEKTYKIQRVLLTNASSYFEKALGGGFKESKTNTLQFPHTDRLLVECFLYFLVCGTAPLFHSLDSVCNTTEPSIYPTRTYINPHLGVRMWIFADQYFIPKLKNQAMGYLHMLAYDPSFSPFEISVVYEALANSTSGSPLNRFMLDIVVRGLRQRAEVSSTGNPRKGWGGNTASNAENANKEDVGYSPSDLLPLKQLCGGHDRVDRHAPQRRAWRLIRSKSIELSGQGGETARSS